MLIKINNMDSELNKKVILQSDFFSLKNCAPYQCIELFANYECLLLDNNAFDDSEIIKVNNILKIFLDQYNDELKHRKLIGDGKNAKQFLKQMKFIDLRILMQL